MLKLFKYACLISLLLIVGCTNDIGHDDDAIAAVVRGEEITIGDLRFLYPDEKVLEMIEGTVKVELVTQEAKRLDLDISDQTKNRVEQFGFLPPGDVETPWANDVRQFAEAQAEKLDMDPDAYYEQYVEITSEQSAYMTAYIEGKLDISNIDVDNSDAFNEKANQLLDDLMKQYEDEIDIRIKQSKD
ncbi:hypothetical protein [Lentibacillus saliphilus]|uniref:hypothetical protein n=1 Tax=Lentibacillus saliphilus TaxID=2737028 RepID=UPI001C2F592D|nr:hypothetical protein [Lentibacillus saliphilus]